MQNAELLKTLDKRFSLNQQSARVVVVGLGITGMSIARFLYGLKLQFVIVDSRNTPPFSHKLLAEMPDIEIFTGKFEWAVFNIATHIIVSPGVCMQEPSIQQAIATGACCLSDIDLFACAVHKPIVAITGSNGKSTVTTLLGDMAIAAGKQVAIGGNLGIPALALINDETQLYILELSSFQLERTTQLNAVVATVLNITADHLDHHANFQAYIAAKQKVYSGHGVMLVNVDCPYAASMQQAGRKVISFGYKDSADYSVIEAIKGRSLAFRGRAILPVDELLIAGIHNQMNALAALALGSVIELPEVAMCEALRNFKGLKHRMQFVAEINQVSWVNDSKATNVGACVAALQSVQDSSVVLIAGGDAKAADMSELIPLLKTKVRALLLIGKDSVLIKQAINNCIPATDVGTLEKAVRQAWTIAQAGNTVLLSPACASLDQFANYKQRGEQFMAQVSTLKQ